MLYDLKEGSVRLGGAETNWISFGKGTRDLVMIPGLVLGLKGLRGSGASLALSYRLFAKDRRVWFFDHPDPLPEHVTVKELADDLAAAMRAVGVERAEVLGVSQGGMIAQVLAVDFPEKVEKLILAVTAPSANETARECVEDGIRMAEGGDHKSLMIDTAEKSYSQAKLKSYRKLYPVLGMVGKPKSYERFLANARAILGFDATGDLGKIACPTLILGGEEDKIVGAEASRELHERIPGSRLYLYPGLGHAAYEEAKDFNRRICVFLK